MKILEFKPGKGTSNVQGYITLSLDVMIEGKICCQIVDVTLMKNSLNGHLFISWPSRSYQTQEGITKYAPQLRWPKEQLDYLQDVVVRKYKDHTGQSVNAHAAQTQQPEYSQTTGYQPKEFINGEEIPF